MHYKQNMVIFIQRTKASNISKKNFTSLERYIQLVADNLPLGTARFFFIRICSVFYNGTVCQPALFLIVGLYFQ